MKKRAYKLVSMEVLCLLRRTKRFMYVEEIARKIRLTPSQVHHAINHTLRPRYLIDETKEKQLVIGYKKPPNARIMIKIKRDKKGKIPKRVDYITNKYENYKIKNKLW